MGVARYRDEEDAKRFGEEWIRGGGGGGGEGGSWPRYCRNENSPRQFPTFLILSLLSELFPKS